MSCCNIKITVDRAGAKRLEAFFEDHGALAVTIEDAGDEPMFDVASPGSPQWQQQIITALIQAPVNSPALDDLTLKLKQDFALQDHQIQIQEIIEQDWERSGLDNFKPIEVEPDFWVYPSWYEVANPQATNIIIDPGLAFGTGSHATTWLCLKQLARIDVKNKTILDFGCGSGILAIAALKRGASAAMAVDIDDKALSCTLENANVNGVSENISVLPPPPYEGFSLPQYDIVFANILAQSLVDLKSTIVATLKPDATLILSGILRKQEDMIKAAYSEFDLHVQGMDDWLVIYGKRHHV